MSDTPFGFGPPDKPGDDDKGSGQPGPLGGDMQQLADMLRGVADMIGKQPAGGGPMNWDVIKDIARHALAAKGDPSVVDAERREVTEALRLADHWLDEVTPLPSGISSPQAWSRSEWIEQTAPVWSKLCDPVAERLVDTMGSTAMPEGMAEMAGPLTGMLRQMAGVMVGSQAGQALSELAGEVVGSADVGLPLAPEGTGALLPAGVAAFGSGLEIPADEVRLYLALREAAHQRLFAHVPWLRSRLLSAVEDYARGITVDLSRLEETVAGIDLSDPEALQKLLGGELRLEPEETPEQRAALARLETMLALIEGWVQTVTDAAAADRLPNAVKLSEAVRRRRATGGPAERTFATLVGLELRPRRMREAATLWAELGKARGNDGRDALWSHPDLMPTSDDLDNPEDFAGRQLLDFDISALDEPDKPDED